MLALLTVALGAGALVLAALWATGRFAHRRRGVPSQALPPGTGAPLDALDLPAARLVPDASEALTLRLSSARLAQRSLDLMYYIWEDDLSGRLLAQSLLTAADRCVRVRLLLDDVNVLSRDAIYRALDRHPRIEVRVFNPVRARQSALLRGIDVVLGFLPYNRRMHGKMWLADGRLALIGGRNVGDAYFDTLAGPGVPYDDLDILISGPVLTEMSGLFDRFWNAGIALPIRALVPGRAARLRRFRARLAERLAEPRAQAVLAGLPPSGPDAELGQALTASPSLAFLADPPDKALGRGRDTWLPESLLPLLRSATREVRIVTPYFVPGRQGTEELLTLVKRGVRVEVITNGLALADNPLVHGAYRWYRARLLAGGVHLIEAAPQAGPRRMLHSKAFVIDGTLGFVGSFNFDLRSAFLNTETGVTFCEPALLASLIALMDAACQPERAWRPQIDGGRILWRRGAVSLGHEPDSTPARRLSSWLIGHLPIHRFL